MNYVYKKYIYFLFVTDVLDYPCYSFLHLTIIPDKQEYNGVRNRTHTCAPVGHPPTYLKTAIYVTPGRVSVLLR
jgi:hypothetical protein